MVHMRRLGPIAAPVLVCAVALALSACGGDGPRGVDSLAADIEDQSPYTLSGCSEPEGQSITCTTKTVSGGGPGAPPAGEDATIVVVEKDGRRTATVTAGGQVIDFFALD
jgi:hypothetical protein